MIIPYPLRYYESHRRIDASREPKVMESRLASLPNFHCGRGDFGKGCNPQRTEVGLQLPNENRLLVQTVDDDEFYRRFPKVLPLPPSIKSGNPTLKSFATLYNRPAGVMTANSR